MFEGKIIVTGSDFALKQEKSLISSTCYRMSKVSALKNKPQLYKTNAAQSSLLGLCGGDSVYRAPPSACMLMFWFKFGFGFLGGDWMLFPQPMTVHR